MFNRRDILPPNSKLPYVKYGLAVAQNIPNNVQTDIIYDTIDKQDNTVFSYNVATGILTINKSGIYLATGVNICSAVGVGERDYLFIYNDGIAITVRNIVSAALGNSGTRLTSTHIFRMLAAGTYKNAYFQNQGVAINLVAGVNQNFVIVTRLSDL